MVYAPLLASYGSCTATLEASPGTRVGLFVTFLDERQMQRMHETEGAYHLVELRGVELLEGLSLQELSRGMRPFATRTTAWAYVHQSGTLFMPGQGQDGQPSPVALAEISAQGRRFPSKRQPEMQDLVR